MSIQNQTPLHVGYGDADLKAPLGASMPGYFTDRKASGALDPLMAKALYFRQGGIEGALVSLDLIGIGAPDVARCRAAIHQATGIPPENVFLHATHTHTGAMVPRSFTSDAKDLVADIYIGTVDQGWIERFPERVAEAVKTAKDASKSGRASFDLGQTTAEKLAFYRRFKMKDGTVRTNPGRKNPDVIAPNGEVDPTVTVLRFPNARAILAVFGLHPDVIGGTQYSADYPYHLSERVKDSLGRDWSVLFLNAACGNINHVDILNVDQKKGYEESTRIGRALGEAVLRALETAQSVDVDRLGFASKVVPSRLRTVPEDVVKEAERVLKEEPARARAFNGLFAPAAVVLGRTRDREQRAEVAAMRIGSIGLAFVPGEYFVELARIIMHDSPMSVTRVIGLTNGALGYIPHEAGYNEGGYESGYRSARFQPGTGELWARTAVGLLQQLAMS